MRMTDNVVQYILSLLEAEHGSAEFRRNELAETMGCVPSQISYVIASRFTPEQGYLVESRRGGGGYIRITRIKRDTPTLLMHLVNSIGESLDRTTAGVILSNLAERKVLSVRDAKLMASAISDQALSAAASNTRDSLRAGILKNLLMAAYSIT